MTLKIAMQNGQSVQVQVLFLNILHILMEAEQNDNLNNLERDFFIFNRIWLTLKIALQNGQSVQVQVLFLNILDVLKKAE